MMGTRQQLREIAVHVYFGKYSFFLRAFADSYVRADQGNEEILRPAWLVLIDRYGLDKDYEEAVG